LRAGPESKMEVAADQKRALMIRPKWIPIILWLLLLGFGVSSSGAAQNQGPCAQIIAACQNAGFVQGGASTGNGLQVDCVRPIMQGKAAKHKASKPLPQVDPQLVAACQAKNPAFGQPQGSRAEAGKEQPMSAPPPPPAHAAAPGSPNIVFILTDDLSMNLVQFMPHVLRMQKDGVTFANYFVTDSLCCPSRSSIFTGRYPHDTGVFKNVGKDGGYLVFRARGNEQSTFATALSAGGYRTAFLGKYLNGYEPQRHHPIAPGWNTWVVAGNGYREFHYVFNQDGQLVRHGLKPADYLTDVVADLGVRFIQQQKGAPFFIEIATFAPHAPYTPAPRDTSAFPDVRAPRTPAYNAPHDAAAPHWLAGHPALTQADRDRIDKDFRKRAQSVLAVDKMIGELQAAVAAIGQAQNTYFIFSSDNGYHMGEYRLMPGKMTAYDTDIHVPLIVTGPGVPAGRTVDEIVENIDLRPTFTELGSATTPANVDGVSLVSLLHGQRVKEWRSAALVEHHGPVREPIDPDMPGVRSGNPTTYEAIRSRTSLYVEYADGEKEYHDLATDPDELRNTFSSLSKEEKSALHKMLDAAANCHDAKDCWAAQGVVRNAPRK
jgi:N-acetylglucosamine-6-sulfatase